MKWNKKGTKSSIWYNYVFGTCGDASKLQCMSYKIKKNNKEINKSIANT